MIVTSPLTYSNGFELYHAYYLCLVIKSYALFSLQQNPRNILNVDSNILHSRSSVSLLPLTTSFYLFPHPAVIITLHMPPFTLRISWLFSWFQTL